jgi:hypothetical protein
MPRFEDYPSGRTFTAKPAAPRIATALEQSYVDQIRNGVEKGYGVFRDGKEQVGANFAGNLIVIQWACGAPCVRMVIVDAQTGAIYYPPISINGIGARSFDLPLLTPKGSVPRNPDVQFRADSDLMVITATPGKFGLRRSYAYYFLWRQSRWAFLRKLPLD